MSSPQKLLRFDWALKKLLRAFVVSSQTTSHHTVKILMNTTKRSNLIIVLFLLVFTTNEVYAQNDNEPDTVIVVSDKVSLWYGQEGSTMYFINKVTDDTLKIKDELINPHRLNIMDDHRIYFFIFFVHFEVGDDTFMSFFSMEERAETLETKNFGSGLQDPANS